MDLKELYPQYEHGLAAAMLVFALLGMGAELAVKDFLAVLKIPKGVTIGSIVQVVLVPLVAWGFIKTVDMNAGLAVGLALVAAMPGGAASNIFTHLGRGNIALSVVLTAVCTLLCLVTTPLAFKLVAPIGESVALEMPYSSVVKEIALYLLLPLVVGMAVGRFAPLFKHRFAKWNIRLSLLMVLVIIVGSVSAGRVDFKTFGFKGIFIVLAFAVAAQQVALWTAVLCRFSPADRLAIIIEITIRNTLLALLLYASMFTPAALEKSPELKEVASGCFFVVLFYGGAAMLVAAPPIIYYKKIILKQEAAEKAERDARAGLPPAPEAGTGGGSDG